MIPTPKSSPSAATFKHLVAVPELWEIIAQSLAPTDLLHLSAVSRAFNAITEKHLYRKITWTWNHSKPDASTAIQQLLLNLLHRPELALHVHEFSVQETGYGPKPRVRHAESNSLRDANVAMSNLIHEAGLSPSEDWIKRLYDLEVETIVALIILQLRNVEMLVIDMFHRDDGYGSPTPNFSPIGDVLRLACEPHSMKRATRFERLQVFSWPSREFDCHTDLIRRGEVLDMLPIFRAPRLREVALKLSCPERPLDAAMPTVSPSDSLTSLTLRYTTVAESFLKQLLSQMKNLEFFRLDLYRSSEAHFFDGQSISQGLMPCRKVLRHLTVHWEPCDDYIEVDVPSSTPLGSLKEFSALESIDATSGAVIDDDLTLGDVLPLTLKVLMLREGLDDINVSWDEGLNSALEEFVDLSPVPTPCLTELRIGVWELLGERAEHDLKERFRQSHGVEVSFFEL
ncbi:f-box domain-containing protein [Fusarium pseudocircinatum]|uniref:F-box domain-containing protein n=1 Tax=Fusarium pseudocircinatum TaxID=56676 RepID=A0A8H5URC5_9HYPO|nr:f-box domain-containing protein [Fusarium pseudocircinatum]